MRPTFRGLLFRTMRMLFLLTLILGGFSACMAGLEGMRAPAPAPGAAEGSREAPVRAP